MDLDTPSTTESNGLSSPSEPKEPLMWVSGKGSMLNIHFAGENSKSLLALFWYGMLDRGIYIAPRGFIALNLELKEQHVEKFVNAIEGFVVRFKQALV